MLIQLFFQPSLSPLIGNVVSLRFYLKKKAKLEKGAVALPEFHHCNLVNVPKQLKINFAYLHGVLIVALLPDGSEQTQVATKLTQTNG